MSEQPILPGKAGQVVRASVEVTGVSVYDDLASLHAAPCSHRPVDRRSSSPSPFSTPRRPEPRSVAMPPGSLCSKTFLHQAAGPRASQSPRTRPPRSVELVRTTSRTSSPVIGYPNFPLYSFFAVPMATTRARLRSRGRTGTRPEVPVLLLDEDPGSSLPAAAWFLPSMSQAPYFILPFTPSPPPLRIGGGGVIVLSNAYCSRPRTRTARGSPQNLDPSALAHNSAASSAVLFASSESSPDHVHRRDPPRLASSSIARCPPG